MKHFLFTILALICLLTGYSQSDNARQSRSVHGFHGVAVSGGINLYLSNGPESVSVSANNETRDHIITEVSGGMLEIHMEENWNHNIGTVNVYVSIPNLKTLEGSGGGDIVFENLIKTEDLDIRLSGGGDLKGKLNANRLVITQSGGSDVNLSGEVQNLSLNASGGGSLKGFGLITEYASIHSSGGSETQLTVNKELKAVTSGGGEITYKGSATVREIKSSGGGSVTHKD